MPGTAVIEAISGEAGAEDAVIPKGDEGTPAPKGQAGGSAKPQEELPTPGTPDPDQEIRAELVKRYGEKSDQELLREVWKSYRSGETTFTQANEKVRSLEELVSKFGGVDALNQALEAPAPAAESKYPDRIQGLIDSGDLDPTNPKDALIIDQELRLEQSNRAIGRSTYNEAVQAFEAGLKPIATKYEYADMDVIRELGYRGAFANMTDQQMWSAIDQLAGKQHAKVTGLVDGKTQEKLEALKNLNEKKGLGGQPGGGKPTAQTARQAFEAEYSKHIKGDE